MLTGVFGSIAVAVSDAFGGPFHSAVARWPGVPVLDDGGSIVTPGTPVEVSCRCQVDVAGEAMRAEAGYRDRDVALIVIGDVALDTDATVEVTAGPSAGVWSVQSVSRDAAGSHWVARGRRG